MPIATQKYKVCLDRNRLCDFAMWGLYLLYSHFWQCMGSRHV